jgi:sugar phosphate isomerase/epimerase
VGPYSCVKTFKYPFIRTAPETLKLCNDIGTGNASLTLDCFHWYTSGASDEGYLEVFTDKNQIIQTHINDGIAGLARDNQADQIREMPSVTGVINIEKFFDCLNTFGYEGPVIIEPFCKRLAALTFEETLDKLKKCSPTCPKRRLSTF